MRPCLIIKLNLSTVALALSMSFFLSLTAVRAQTSENKKQFTSNNIQVVVQWQMMRSRSQSALAGTMTESYAVEWKLTPHGESATVASPHSRLDVPWSLSGQGGKVGMLLLSRLELVRLLGIDSELPQDGRVWQSDAPLMIFIQPPSGRASDPIFRHSDDDGTVVIRLSARVASRP